MTDARSGYLLLADISGYTGFLNDSELEHARGTSSDLLGLMIDQPPLTISKLEGDAVFSRMRWRAYGAMSPTPVILAVGPGTLR